jgi:hypothetical protein
VVSMGAGSWAYLCSQCRLSRRCNIVVVEDFEDFEDGDLDVSSCGQGCATSDSDSGGEASDLDLGSTSDDSDSEECDADSDLDQYSILDYEN